MKIPNYIPKYDLEETYVDIQLMLENVETEHTIKDIFNILWRLLEYFTEGYLDT